MLGVASSPAIFQRIMEGLLQGIPGIAIYLDDILIIGWDYQEHLHTMGLIYETNTTENWAYGRFYAKLGIYQYGRERWLRSNLTSGLSRVCKV